VRLGPVAASRPAAGPERRPPGRRSASWLTLPLAAKLVRTVREHADGPTLNEVLAQTGMLQLAFCLLLSAGVLAS